MSSIGFLEIRMALPVDFYCPGVCAQIILVPSDKNKRDISTKLGSYWYVSRDDAHHPLGDVYYCIIACSLGNYRYLVFKFPIFHRVPFSTHKLILIQSRFFLISFPSSMLHLVQADHDDMQKQITSCPPS